MTPEQCIYPWLTTILGSRNSCLKFRILLYIGGGDGWGTWSAPWKKVAQFTKLYHTSKIRNFWGGYEVSVPPAAISKEQPILIRKICPWVDSDGWLDYCPWSEPSKNKNLKSRGIELFKMPTEIKIGLRSSENEINDLNIFFRKKILRRTGNEIDL